MKPKKKKAVTIKQTHFVLTSEKDTASLKDAKFRFAEGDITFERNEAIQLRDLLGRLIDNTTHDENVERTLLDLYVTFNKEQRFEILSLLDSGYVYEGKDGRIKPFVNLVQGLPDGFQDSVYAALKNYFPEQEEYLSPLRLVAK